MPLEDALAQGATAIFGEKYGETVRVVAISGVSMELCGGIHVGSTGELGLFKLVSEAGVAAGIRRIEALAGKPAWDFIGDREGLIEEMTERLKVKPQDLPVRIDRLLQTVKAQESELSKIQAHLAFQKRDELLAGKKIVEGVPVVSGRVDFMGPRELRNLSDLIRDRIQEGLIILAASSDNRVHWVVGNSVCQPSGLHAGQLVNAVAQITGGKGGGRPDLAEGSGKDPQRIDQALESLPQIITKMLSGVSERK
jgi:alanyl-tRNA synthetase